MFDVYIKVECESCSKRSDTECDKCFNEMPQKQKDMLSLKIGTMVLADANGKDVTPKISIKPEILLWVTLAAEKHNIEPLHSECYRVWKSWDDGAWLNKLSYPKGLFSNILSYLQFQKLSKVGLGKAMITNGKLILLNPLPDKDWFYSEDGSYKK